MSPLFGHEEAVATFRESLDGGRLHHAWLLSGPLGVGKALFADKAALRTLAAGMGTLDAAGLDTPPDHPAAKLVEAGSHPDLMRLERLPRDSGTELARSITVDQVRGLYRLFATTPSLSPRRAVIVDAADDLERAAANALLKNLEEPPPDTLFLLVSHAPERLLPTIRSRCRHLRLQRLAPAAMTSALQTALPEADEQELAELAQVGEGSPGRAIAWRGLDIAQLDAALTEIAIKGDPTNARRVKLAQSLGSASAQPRYEAFLARAPSFIAAQARERQGRALAEAIALWERAQALAGSAIRLSLDPQTTIFELAGIVAALAPQKAHA